MIKLEKLYEQTNGGATLFQAYFPDFDPGKASNQVKLRDDDDHPSASIFPSAGKWLIKDHGGSDNKAKDMVAFVMEREHLEFRDALVSIAKTCGLAVDEEASHAQTGAIMSKVAPSRERRLIRRKSGKFTKRELSFLGGTDRNGEPCITQEICDQFSLVPLDGYINPTKDNQASWKVEASEDYPIMYYDYGEWGKIYQPFGDVRFMYYGKKPEHYLFGCNMFQEAWQKALKGIYPHVPDFTGKKAEKTDDDLLSEEKDERWESLTICSGPSDALNVYCAGHVVCWPNSESEPLSQDVIRRLMKLTRNLYVLYDADATGVKNAYNLALRNLDIKIITLPKDLGTFPTGKRDKDGKPKMCKDIKDYCMYYKRGHIDPYKDFKYKLVKLAKPLRFWTESISKDGKLSCEISNAHLYNFLSANGFARMRTNEKGGVVYTYTTGRIVEVINDDDIVARVRGFLIDYIKENSEYYSTQLENTIYRSKQINQESMKCIDEIYPDFEAFDAQTEYFFFRNCIVRINADGITRVKDEDCPYSVLKHKVIDHDLRLIKPLYEIDYTEQYQYAAKNQKLFAPLTPEYKDFQDFLDKLTKNNEKYSLRMASDFDFVRYIYNTGNKFWREEEEAKRNNTTLTESERAAVNRNFINKVTTLGYLLTKYKNPGIPKAVYCIEPNVLEEDEGSHNGGTGKSIYMNSVGKLRNTVFMSGQRMKGDDDQFLYQSVDFDTDVVKIDDLSSKVDLNVFLPDITGALTINKKNKDAFSISYAKSPKFCITSNHAIRRFNGSLRRRIQFASFSDYYHSANDEAGMEARSPYTEFGRNLLDDYSEEDMNTFYNFMLQNVVAFMKFGLVEPDMPDIAMRQMKAEIGLEFINWADQWFEQNRFNKIINKDEAFEAWKSSLNRKELAWVTPNKFKKKIIGWCNVRGYVYNPDFQMRNRTATEKQRNEIRFTDDVTGKPCYGFFIENKNADQESQDDCPW